MVLLRPLRWLNEQQAKVGGTVFISVPECGIDGNAEVLAIEPCPEILPGDGRVITGTFRHQVSASISLSIAGQQEPILCTGNHPFWSEDRNDFVRADSLQPNETLRTTSGSTTVTSLTHIPGSTAVYNLEIHGTHVYHVGSSGVLVHNGSFDWRTYEALVLNYFGVPRGEGFRQVLQSTTWGRRILDGLSSGRAFEITMFDFRGNFDLDKTGKMRAMFNNKLIQLEKDVQMLKNGRINRLTIVTANPLAEAGEGAEYTRRLHELMSDKEIGHLIEYFHLCPGAL